MRTGWVRQSGVVGPTRVGVGRAYGVVACLDTLLAAGLGPRRARWLTKPALVPLLAAGLVAEPSSPGRRAALVGQALSWGGDVALLRRDRGSFLAGLGLFLGAHVGYVTAFRSRSSTRVLGSPGRRRALAVGVVAASGMATVAGREDRALALPVAAYGVTLATMAVTAAAVDADRGRAAILPGAVLFVVSDGLIGLKMFVLCRPRPGLDGAVMATYTAAQWGIRRGWTTEAAHA